MKTENCRLKIEMAASTFNTARRRYEPRPFGYGIVSGPAPSTSPELTAELLNAVGDSVLPGLAVPGVRSPGCRFLSSVPLVCGVGQQRVTALQVLGPRDVRLPGAMLGSSFSSGSRFSPGLDQHDREFFTVGAGLTMRIVGPSSAASLLWGVWEVLCVLFLDSRFERESSKLY